jgi:hypothetical protein
MKWPWSKAPRSAFLQLVDLHREAERRIGSRPWALLSGHGKLNSGPNSGRYVSGLPAKEQLRLIDRLLNGETLDIHLMHRYVSGDTERSTLRWASGVLWMVFEDREEEA